MHALVAQGTEHRIPDPGVACSNRVRGASGPSPSGRASRPQREGRGFEPRRLHDMRHAAACKRRHSEERRHVKTARPRDGIRRQRPPAGRARDGGAGRPVRGPARADVVQRQHARFPSRRPRVRIPSIRLAWEYRFPWISPGREDARAVRPAAPAGGINTSVTTGKKGRRALANAGIQAPSGVQAPDVHSEAGHPLSTGGRHVAAVRRIRKKHGHAG